MDNTLISAWKAVKHIYERLNIPTLLHPTFLQVFFYGELSLSLIHSLMELEKSSKDPNVPNS